MGQPRVPCLRAILTPILLAPTCACVVHVDADDVKVREERRFTVSGTPDVRLATFDGSIKVRGWDRNEVYVEIEKLGRDEEQVKAIEVLADQSGSRLNVEVRQPAPTKYGFGVVTTLSRSARLIASVPIGSNLVLRTGDGAINVERVSGRLEFRTGDGNVGGLELHGDVFAHTDDGAIKVEGLDGRCDLATGDGSINVSGRFDALQARTGDGQVVVKVQPGSRATSDWSLSTSDGSMVVYLPEGFGIQLDAEADDSRVRVDPALGSGEVDESRGVFRGRLGAGGRLLRLRTGDGPITLKRLPGKPPPLEMDVER
jgi:Putative adhesin